MSHPDQLHDEVSDFDRAYMLALDDLNQGVERDLEDYLRLVPAEEQAELASLIGATLSPRIAAQAADFAEGYAHAMTVIDAVDASAGPTGVLPGAIETMSNARGIKFDDIVDALAVEFDVKSDSGRAAMRRYYHRLRSGQLLGSKITHRLLAALARIFDAEPGDFIAAARPAGAGRTLAAAPAMPRPAGDVRRAASPIAPADPEVAGPEEELVLRLFCGGPDA